eukprot:TRINITY_DN14476_c0_g1_i1.p1 TRINITY_DN14476_c0_g1~~TRINITY_DN14476_c0_g1_i1.p1  ORF type:complete len:926 (-),score=56.91 TRINITY_DN14476_c0_g1_i1:72-2849(-)
MALDGSSASRLAGYRAWLFALCVGACQTVSASQRRVILHSNGPNDGWSAVDREYWPCLQTVMHSAFIFMNNFGCSPSPRENDEAAWLMPDGPGAIRLARDPDYCIDASEALDFMKRQQDSVKNHTFLESLVRRLVLIRKCDSSPSQQFVTSQGYHEGTAIFHLASSPTHVLSNAGVALALSSTHWPGEAVEFMVRDHLDWSETSIFGHYKFERGLIWTLNALTLVLLLAYLTMCFLSFVRRCRKVAFLFSSVPWRIRSVFIEIFTWPKVCARIIKEKITAQQKDNERRERLSLHRLCRVQNILPWFVHIMAFWLVHSFNQRVGFGNLNEFLFGEPYIIMWKRLDLLDTELLPALVVTIVAFVVRMCPIKQPLTFDLITIAIDIMWGFKYYAMCLGASGSRMEYYLYNESWMFASRILLHVSFGRAAVTIPCSVCLTVFDVYCLRYLAASHVHAHHLVNSYPFKQFFIVVLQCMLQYGLEHTFEREMTAAATAHDANLHRKLATRLIGSLCDAVVHLDDTFHFMAPATKLASILLRDRLGLMRTCFTDIVSSEDKARFVEYLRSIALMSADQPLMPIQINLLDASTLPCKVQIVASAVSKSDNAQVVYILGIGEVSDMFEARRETSVAENRDGFWLHDSIVSKPDNLVTGIPELIAVSYEEEAERQSSISSCSSSGWAHESWRQEIVSFQVSIHSISGDISSYSEGFEKFVRTNPEGQYLPSMFHRASSVWAWLQMTIGKLQECSDIALQELMLGPIEFDVGHGVYDAEIELVKCDADGSVTFLILRLSSCTKTSTRHQKRGKPLSKSKRAFFQDVNTQGVLEIDMAADIQIRVRAATLADAINASKSAAFAYVNPIQDASWIRKWWTKHEKQITHVPFVREENPIWVIVDKETHSGAYIVDSCFSFSLVHKREDTLPHIFGRASL